MSVARSDARSTPPVPSPEAVAVVSEAAPHLDRLAEVAAAYEGDSVALLHLLRQLEKLHRTIQDGAFRASLPSDRGSLFRLLQDMEQSGGWPYIPRLQLRTFLDLLQPAPSATPAEASSPGADHPAAPAPASESLPTHETLPVNEILAETLVSEGLSPRDHHAPEDHFPEAA